MASIMTPLLYKALFSMDAYNRGYNQGIVNLGSNSQLGWASILDDSNVLKDIDGKRRDQPTGFYGIAYNLNGQKVIAYRGTDELVTWPSSDIWNGYGVGLGYTAGDQAMLAFQFYRAVAGTGVDPRTANIALTGHSLGGGLAGLVANVYGKDGALFNNMAFEEAAQDAYTAAMNPDDYDVATNLALKNTIYGNVSPWPTPYLSNIVTHYTKGDFLIANRLLQNHQKIEHTFVSQEILDAGLTTAPELTGTQAHSMSTMVLLTYAETLTGDPYWQLSSKYLWPVLYADGFSSQLGGIKNITGSMLDKQDYSGILRTVLAYSIIDDGVTVFGSTGAKALFDDATDFGRALAYETLSPLITKQAINISEIMVQFAGGLAIKKSILATYATGALTALMDPLVPVEDAEATGLHIDLSAVRWAESMNGATLIIGGEAMLSDLIFNVADKTTNQSLMRAAWGVTSLASFDAITLATQVAGATTIIPFSGLSTKASLVMGESGNDVMTASAKNDFMIGGLGNDYLNGADGKDILVGGAGSDALIGGAGTDYLYGNDGLNILIGGTGVVTGIGMLGASVSGLVDDASRDYMYSGDSVNSLYLGRYDIAFGGKKWIAAGVGSSFYIAGSVVYGGAADETVSASGSYANAVMGGGGKDVISGAAGADLLWGGAGFYNYRTPKLAYTGADFGVDDKASDSIKGGAGNDTIYAGDSDRAEGEAGNDTIYGGAGRSVMYGGDGNDRIWGEWFVNNAASTVAGMANPYISGDDWADGGAGADMLLGMNGNDVLGGGAGSDTVYGGMGNDQLHSSVIDFRDTVGLLPNNGNNVLYGEAGNDSIFAREGNDTAFGGEGNDTIYGSNDNTAIRVLMYGGLGKDSMIAGVGNDIIFGNDDGSEADYINGRQGNDILSGGAGDTIYGGNGDDKLYGAIGSFLYGEAGIDTFYVPTGFNLTTNSDYTKGIDIVVYDASPYIYKSSVVLTGSSSNNTLVGTVAAESFIGLAGHDSLSGLDGNDTLDGGSGRDTLTGGNGADVYLYTSLLDSRRGDSTTDVIVGFNVVEDSIDLSGLGFYGLTTKTATLVGELRLTYNATSNRTFIMNDQNDFEISLEGDHRATLTDQRLVYASGANVVLNVVGTANADALTGSAVSNMMYGLAGNDTLSGLDGNDTLDGGAGADQLIGGTGNDTYRFSTLTASQETSSLLDRVTNFALGEDYIDLRGLGFIGLDTDGGATEIGELRLEYSGTTLNRTYVKSDQSTFEFALDGNYTTTILLSDADFLFA